MAIVIGTVRETVPTVQFGNVQVGPVTIMRPVPNTSRQHVVDEARRAQRDAEYVCGAERRSVQWATNPDLKFASPIPIDEAPGAPYPGYDPNLIENHPADVPGQPGVVAKVETEEAK